MSLPKGGGAIAGMGEKVRAIPVTGSASVGIALPLTPGRGGFTPALSLSYDSGAGNGAFGLGWRLSLPSIRRKTDRGLPRYRDDIDVFVLSDAEDLGPIPGATRVDGEYDVARFRPRVEGGFARIERWTRRADGRVHWRTTSRDNVRRTYGLGDGARLIDPDDPRRVFEWRLEREEDERGNVIAYTYASEDRVSRRNRPSATAARPGTASRTSTRSGCRGGNAVDGSFRFHLVFGYGDHQDADPGLAPDRPWPPASMRSRGSGPGSTCGVTACAAGSCCSTRGVVGPLDLPRSRRPRRRSQPIRVRAGQPIREE